MLLQFTYNAIQLVHIDLYSSVFIRDAQLFIIDKLPLK